MFEIVFHLAEIALLGWGIFILKNKPQSKPTRQIVSYPKDYENQTFPESTITRSQDDEFWSVFDSASGKFLFNRCEFHPDIDELLRSEKFKVEKTCRQ